MHVCWGSGVVRLLCDEIDAREVEIEGIVNEQGAHPDSHFVVESPDKLRRITQHFPAHLVPAHLGRNNNVAARCNAPWVAAVIEASGDVRPFFFHPPLGHIHRRT
jgi:hypothetical protein